jgi:disulfide bond formation protein DsbB
MNLRALAQNIPPHVIAAGLAGVSVVALIAAFASEAFLGLEPCKLCIYQRWPYVVAAILGTMGFIAHARPRLLAGTLAGCTLSFGVNACIALYHSGVERHWWASAVEGCAVPDFAAAPQTMLENILSAPTGRCDEIPWADPLLGLSMANYNVALGLVLAVVSLYTLMRLRAQQ